MTDQTTTSSSTQTYAALLDISLGSTQKLVEESSEALAKTCQELERQLPQEPVLNSDETFQDWQLDHR